MRRWQGTQRTASRSKSNMGVVNRYTGRADTNKATRKLTTAVLKAHAHIHAHQTPTSNAHSGELT